jgi:hypothetical protein
MNLNRNKSADFSKIINVNKTTKMNKINSKKNLKLQNYRKNSFTLIYKNFNEENDKIKTEPSLSKNPVNSKLVQDLKADKEYKKYVKVK